MGNEHKKSGKSDVYKIALSPINIGDLAMTTFNRFRTRPSARKGFTLMELLIVLAILVVILGIVGTSVMSSWQSAKIKSTQLQVADLMNGLERFRIDNGRYPYQEEGLEILLGRINNPNIYGNQIQGGDYNGGGGNNGWGNNGNFNGGGNGGSGIGTDLVGMVAQMKIAETMMEKFNFPGMSTPAPVTAPAPAPVATPAPAPAPASATWTCPECGEDGNTKKFCMNCGKPKPEPKVEPEGWTCPDCGHTGNKGKFCEECGIPKPAATWDCPTCGEKDIKGKFCPECGTKRA